MRLPPVSIIKRHAEQRHLEFEDHVCTVCPLGKHTKLPFQLSTTVSKCVLDLLHYDI